MASEFHSLSAEQIRQLTEQGCSSCDWGGVWAVDGFDPARVRSTHFSGDVRLGVFERQVSFPGGIDRPAGISNATIHNCCIGNNVYINHVKNYIANYVIEDDVIIENVDILSVEGESSFGNGRSVAVKVTVSLPLHSTSGIVIVATRAVISTVNSVLPA